MNKPETFKVTKDNGPRPAGKPNRCFYCHKPLGDEHSLKCVLRQRTVVLDFTIRTVISVPQSWTKEDIEFRYGQSTWCTSNLFEALDKYQGCLCSRTSSTFIAEATEQDEQIYGLIDC